MAGEVWTGVYLTGRCLCCAFDSFEELGERSSSGFTADQARADVELTKEELNSVILRAAVQLK